MEFTKSVKCPNCLNLVSDNSESCPHCKVEFYNCSNCNALALEKDKFCKNCNSKLDDIVDMNTANDTSVRKTYWEGQLLNIFLGLIELVGIIFLIYWAIKRFLL